MIRNKKKDSEWVGIGDLMAGVIGMIVLMLVSAMIQAKQSDSSLNEKLQEKAAEVDDLRQEIDGLSGRLGMATRKIEDERKKDSLNQARVQAAWNDLPPDIREIVVLKNGVFYLAESGFASGEYCVSPNLNQALRRFAPNLRKILAESSRNILIIEGHADPDPILGPPNQSYCFSCSVKNNVDLALCRALAAKKIIIEASGMDYDLSERIGVISYGFNKQVGSHDQDRRVEIRIEYNQ